VSDSTDRRLRVVQWATGNIGTRSLQAIIDHPFLDLVGVYVHDPAKVGRDAGDLAGRPPTGVIATSNIDEILALGANCVLYMPDALRVDEVVSLLTGGSNVVTTRGEFHRPASMDPSLRDRVESACAAGGTSIHSTGSSPGFISEALPLVLTSIQRRLDRLVIDEYADLSRRNSPGLLFDVMGFGKPPAETDPRRYTHGAVSFGPSLRLVADAVGLPLDAVEGRGEIALATRSIEIAAGTIGAGTVAGQRMVVEGRRNGRTLMQFRTNWYCTTELDQDWPLQRTGWHIAVEGDTPLDIAIDFPIELDQMAAVTPGYTAHRAVNAVKYVCEAAPGIRTILDLPTIVAHLGGSS
jgi:4-hydroxy-tetrahydrodipicolinate reductase